MQELTAVFLGERFRFANPTGDIVIGEAKCTEKVEGLGSPLISIKGPSDIDELAYNQTYRFFGQWSVYENRRTGRCEKQFHFNTFTEATPTERNAIIEYLRKTGEGHGIGKQRSEKIFDLFGETCLQILRENPERVSAAIKGLSLDECLAVSRKLEEKKDAEKTIIEVGQLLAGRSFPKDLTRQIINTWGVKAAKIIRKDPFALLRFNHCGFKKCDALHSALKLDPARLRRQTYSASHFIQSDRSGSIWIPAKTVAESIISSIGISANWKKAIHFGKRLSQRSPNHYGALSIAREKEGRIVSHGGEVFIASTYYAEAERRLAANVSNRMRTAEMLWPNLEFVSEIDSHQREEIEKALSGPVAILGGSPGTGKTFSAAQIIKALIRSVGESNILVGAPTGKAAVRITQAMNAYGINLTAKTWHSHLGMGLGGGWAHDENDPWPQKIILGDEESMKDLILMEAVFNAAHPLANILLIGDVHQLPPVGVGAPLRDLIKAGIPYGELTKIKRNSGGIVEACAAIRDVQDWSEGDNLKIHHAIKPAQQIQILLNNLDQLESDGIDPIWDVQTIVALNEKSEISRKKLNTILQKHLNHNQPINNSLFRIGDKAVNLENANFTLLKNENGQVPNGITTKVANGEIGKVIEIADKQITIELEYPYRVIRVPKGKSNETESGCSWDLGYALSCHKSQGSQWKHIFVMIDPAGWMVCDRSWLYTAISRAETACHLIGQKSVADQFCKQTKIHNRKTFLAEMIQLHSQPEIEL